MGKRFKERKKRIRIIRILLMRIGFIIVTLSIIIVFVKYINARNKAQDNTAKVSGNLISSNVIERKENEISKPNDNLQNEITESTENPKLDWKLTLVNSSHPLPEDYTINLTRIDRYREFDSRATENLQNMINGLGEDGITDIWVQSAYRGIEEQEQVYNDKVEFYKRQGKTLEEAEALTEKIINKPGCSDHNLGLAVDFNYVDNSFEKTKAFKWLKNNAEDYGFILRYPKEKENITKVTYEPWHWRYVGEENAKEMNELGFCLEEYVEYLQN